VYTELLFACPGHPSWCSDTCQLDVKACMADTARIDKVRAVPTPFAMEPSAEGPTLFDKQIEGPIK